MTSMLAAEALLIRRAREKFRGRHRHKPGSWERICSYLVTLDMVSAIRLIRKSRT